MWINIFENYLTQCRFIDIFILLVFIFFNFCFQQYFEGKQKYSVCVPDFADLDELYRTFLKTLLFNIYIKIYI